MGFLEFAEDKKVDAEKEFAQAYTLDNALYLSLFYQIMLSPLVSSNSVSDTNAFATSLGNVLRLNPKFAPAYVQLAILALRTGDLTSALRVSRRAEELEPSLAGYHLLTARILQRMGKSGEAGDYAKFVADRWIGPDHDEAVELWNNLPADARPILEPVSEAIPKDTQTAEGTVKSVACGDQGQGAFVLDHDGHLLTFHRKTGEVEFGFSDTIWYGADHFSLCHHLVGTRAVVRYHLPSDSTYAGDIVEMGIRDDLPQDFHQTANSPTITSATP
jgi:tetratricopeptide (TPR) repeat protein